MIVTVRTWYLGRSARERRMLLLMLAIALPLLVWLLFVRPLNRAYEAALQDQLEAVDRNGRVRALAKLVDQKPQGNVKARLGPDLVVVVAESATQAGIPLDSNEARGPDEVRISAASASLRSVVPWLQGLETRGLGVAELRVVPGQAGMASVTARLKRSME